MITVELADDQALVRAGFRALLDSEDGIAVVAEAAERLRRPSGWPAAIGPTSS